MAGTAAMSILWITWKDRWETVNHVEKGLYLHASQLSDLFSGLDSLANVGNKGPGINLYGVISRVENLPGKGFRVTLNTQFPEEKIECLLPPSAGRLLPESYVGLNGCLCRDNPGKLVFKASRVVFHRLPASHTP
jgi:hypothetical protein